MTEAGRVILVAVLGLLLLGIASCGKDATQQPGLPEADSMEVPEWANVAPEQIAEATKHAVPVAFENDLGMRFVLIPAGTFSMGSTEDEEGRFSWSEKPREVEIVRPYYMQTTEVTNGQYSAWKPDHDSGEWSGHRLDGGSQPVVQVSWNDAGNFARWLSERMGRTYRLPTEVEWERACRAGTRTRFSWGDQEEDAHRFVNGNDSVTSREFAWDKDAFPRDDGHRVAAPVGSYLPNAWGLYDMHGNVWEWCMRTSEADDASERTTTTTGRAPRRMNRVRGGSWHSMPRQIRSANRDAWKGDGRYHSAGFRLVSPLPHEGE